MYKLMFRFSSKVEKEGSTTNLFTQATYFLSASEIMKFNGCSSFIQNFPY